MDMRRQVQRLRGLSRFQKSLLVAAIGLLVYAVVGFFVVPPVVRNILATKLAETTLRQVKINKIRINPFTLTATVEGFRVLRNDREESLVAFEQLVVNFQSVSIFKKALVVKSLRIANPSISVTRTDDQIYNFSDLLAGNDASAQEESTGMLFSVNNIEITSGQLDFEDLPKMTNHQLRNLEVAIPFISNLAYSLEEYVQPSFAAVINGTPIAFGGRTKPFGSSKETVFDVKVQRVVIPDYLAYLPEERRFDLASAYLDINGTLSFFVDEDNRPVLSLAGNIDLQDIDLVDLAGESFFRLPELKISMEHSNLLGQEIHIADLTCKEPWFSLTREENGNLMPITLFLPEEKVGSSTPSLSQDEKLSIAIDKLSCAGGTMEFNDQSRSPVFLTVLQGVDLTVASFSTDSGTQAQFSLALRTESNEMMDLEGGLVFDPLTVVGKAGLEGFLLKKYNSYAEDFITSVIGSGVLNLDAEYSYAKSDLITANRIAGLSASVADLQLVDASDNSEILRLPKIRLDNGVVDLLSRDVIIADLAVEQASVQLVREENNSINLTGLLRAPKVDSPDQEVLVKEEGWNILLSNGAIRQSSLHFLDRKPQQKVDLEIVVEDFLVQDISTSEGSRGDFASHIKINDSGTLAAKGDISINPVALALQLDIKNISLTALQPYLQDFANLVISDGAVDLAGSLDVSAAVADDFAIAFAGNGEIANFISLDPLLGEEFIRWQGLRVNGIDFRSESDSLKIATVDWEKFDVRVLVAPDGTINLQSVLRPVTQEENGEEETITSSAKEARKKRISIDSINWQGGQFYFTDRKISPHYEVHWGDVAGNITNLTSAEGETAEVDISGRLAEHTPLTVTGRINPLREDIFIDLTFAGSSIELSPMTPYFGKYIGYKVDKGMLTLDLQYHVENNELKGKNNAFLDQFTLGETVDSPDAVSLPIGLAIALLKNRQGEISLNVPVHGRLDDPAFSIGGIVFKAFINLIAKAATSPFALLGALLPGGEDLQFVAFDPGSSHVAGTGEDKLDTMAKALFERPGLKVDVVGFVQRAEDSAALLEAFFAQLLKVEKMRKIAGKEKDPALIEQAEVKPDEYEKYLKLAFRSHKLKKPSGYYKLSKEEKSAVMEKMLRETVTVTDDDLRLLAIRRATAVKDYLVNSGPVTPERIFLIEPRVPVPSGEEVAESAMRAEMTLK